jgi:dodecin
MHLPPPPLWCRSFTGIFPAGANMKGKNMTMLKVIEVLAESPDGFDQAAQTAVTKAAETVRNIKSIYIKDMSAHVEGGKISSYRVTAKITFALEA